MLLAVVLAAVGAVLFVAAVIFSRIEQRDNKAANKETGRAQA